MSRFLRRDVEAGAENPPAKNADPRYGRCTVTVERRPDGASLLRSKQPLGTYPQRFHDYLFEWANLAPDRTFLAERTSDGNAWTRITFAEAAEKVRLIAAALADRELGPERPVLILSGNAIDHQLLALGSMTAGIPYASISVAYSLVSQDHGKLKHIVKLLDPGLIYASDAETYARALAIPEMQGREIVVGRPSPSVEDTTSFTRLLEGGSRERLITAEKRIGLDTIVKFLFTSGSTGVPKAVITTQRMICSNHHMMAHAWTFLDRRPPVLVDWLPWSHVFGGNCSVGFALRWGGTFYIDDGKPMPADIGRTIRNLREVSPTVYFNVPRGFDFIATELRNDGALRKRFFADLDMMFYAAASLPEHLWKLLADMAETSNATPPSMLTGWGLTETAPAILLLHEHGGMPGNLGSPLPGLELKLVPNGRKLEARVRGPNVTPGYWRMPEATAKAFDEEGYFITGDALAFIDEREPRKGIRFNGRVVEDFKLSSGTWVHTASIRERALQSLAGLILDVVVTAPDRDDVGLLVFPSPGAVLGEAYMLDILTGLRRMNEGAGGLSQRIARAMVMREPPSLDKGEMTDKGSLNMHGILHHRGGLVDRLYAGDDAEVLRP
jgi:feruloyl-CoA synthase